MCLGVRVFGSVFVWEPSARVNQLEDIAVNPARVGVGLFVCGFVLRLYLWVWV